MWLNYIFFASTQLISFGHMLGNVASTLRLFDKQGGRIESIDENAIFRK